MAGTDISSSDPGTWG